MKFARVRIFESLTFGTAILVSLSIAPTASAQTAANTQRPPTFAFPEVQSMIPSGEPKAMGSTKTKATLTAASHGRGRQISSGRATYYEHPGRTASGEPYNPNGLTAAHHSLPFGTRIRVVNKSNGRAVVVRITDRTNQKTNATRPYVIDLSRRSAHAIGITSVGMVALYQAE
ncbi:septal ring lytic transglycosylase RlpA family protein [Methylobacterium sp. C25]|uniref:septal ring lytic transglycosylase RlpA family protein n=1 Tax=Methylobacterium sp. C25 TaxID=2721622 RepID=UPI003FA382F2